MRLAGIAYLKGRSEIDPAQIGLLGHSEGGLVAPLAASRSGDVGFIVMMAGTGLPGRDILKAQLALILKADGVSEAEQKYARAGQRRLIEILLQEKDAKVVAAKVVAAYKEVLVALPEAEKKAVVESGEVSEAMIAKWNTPWFRSFLVYDPRPTLRKVRCPVLAIDGEIDLQVSATENLAEIRKALEVGGNRDVKIVEFKGLNHLLQPCTSGSPSEYARIETTIAPEVLKAIGDWIVEHTSSK